MTNNELQTIAAEQSYMLDRAHEAFIICAEIFDELPPEVIAQMRSRIDQVAALCAEIGAGCAAIEQRLS